MGSVELDCGGGEAVAGDDGCASAGLEAVGFGVGLPDDAGSGDGVCASASEAKASAKAISENLGTQPFISKAS